MRAIIILFLILVVPSGCDRTGFEPKAESDATAKAETDDTAEKAIKVLGGKTVRFNNNAPDKPIALVYLNRPNVTDRDLKILARLAELRELALDGANVTDIGLAELTGLVQLQSIGLGQTKVTDAGLKLLAKLPRLTGINLD